MRRPALTVVSIALSAIVAAACSASNSSKGHASGTSSSGGPLAISEQSAPLPRSEILILSQIVSEVAGTAAPTGSAQITASQSNKSQSGLNQLGATRTDQGVVITLPEKVLFDFDKSDLRPDAQPILAQIAPVLAGYPNARIQVRGFTDSKGTDAYNLGLSQHRADAVKNALVNQFHLGANLVAKGFGKSDPVAPNTNPDGSDDPAGRAQNRRVEVLIVGA